MSAAAVAAVVVPTMTGGSHPAATPARAIVPAAVARPTAAPARPQWHGECEHEGGHCHRRLHDVRCEHKFHGYECRGVEYGRLPDGRVYRHTWVEEGHRVEPHWVADDRDGRDDRDAADPRRDDDRWDDEAGRAGDGGNGWHSHRDDDGQDGLLDGLGDGHGGDGWRWHDDDHRS